MATIYVFKDKDGDYFYSDSAEVATGTTGVLVYKAGIEHFGGQPKDFWEGEDELRLKLSFGEVTDGAGFVAEAGLVYHSQFESDRTF